ncbi:MAG: hypothetical protein Q7V20_11450, partial [Aquabacterium sp.]|uniref:hypothetical protein n=1 Tax=Aquabacterium sp. TaxID=1872578 RepID=UPI0027184F0C
SFGRGANPYDRVVAKARIKPAGHIAATHLGRLLALFHEGCKGARAQCLLNCTFKVLFVGLPKYLFTFLGTLTTWEFSSVQVFFLFTVKFLRTFSNASGLGKNDLGMRTVPQSGLLA